MKKLEDEVFTVGEATGKGAFEFSGRHIIILHAKGFLM